MMCPQYIEVIKYNEPLSSLELCDNRSFEIFKSSRLGTHCTCIRDLSSAAVAKSNGRVGFVILST